MLLCHCMSGKRSEYVTCCATVRRECLWRRQFAFIGPPAPVLFHKLPGVFHLMSPSANPWRTAAIAASRDVAMPLVCGDTRTTAHPSARCATRKSSAYLPRFVFSTTPSRFIFELRAEWHHGPPFQRPPSQLVAKACIAASRVGARPLPSRSSKLSVHIQGVAAGAVEALKIRQRR